MIGVQNEVIYFNFFICKLVVFGFDQCQVVQSLQVQNVVILLGVVEVGFECILVCIFGNFCLEKDLQVVNLWVNDCFYWLFDLVSISCDFVDLLILLFCYKGELVIGLVVVMKEGGNIFEFGEVFNVCMQEIIGELLVGVGVYQVLNQVQVVKKVVGGFIWVLFEVVVIVFIVSFVSFGLCVGLVVVCLILLVLVMVFVFMEYIDIIMQWVFFGVLIIVFGLLVDDVMIIVEMMIMCFELGDLLYDLVIYVYILMVFLMFIGILVMVVGFVFIGFNVSFVGEYIFILFVVIVVVLLLLWIVVVLFVLVIVVYILLKIFKYKLEQKKGCIVECFDSLLYLVMCWCWMIIFFIVLLFGVLLFLMKFVQYQFFLFFDCLELLVDFNLLQNSSIYEIRVVMDCLEVMLKDDEDIDYWSVYVGEGVICFYLLLDQQLQNNFYGQLVIVIKDLEVCECVVVCLCDCLCKDYVGISIYVQLLEMGLLVGWLIQYWVSGLQIDKVCEYVMGLVGVFDGNLNIGDIVYDWNEFGKMFKIDIVQDKVCQFGFFFEDVVQIMNSVVIGSVVIQVCDDIYLVNVIGCVEDSECGLLEILESLQIVMFSGILILFKVFVKVSYELEQLLVWCCDCKLMIMVKVLLCGEIQFIDLVVWLVLEVKCFVDGLLVNYWIEVGGMVEESGKVEGLIVKVVLLMLFFMVIFLMIQLQSVQKLFLVVSVVLLGLIGVVVVLLLIGMLMGFVVIFGIFVLIGIIICNLVILVIQIDVFEKDGKMFWEVVLEVIYYCIWLILLMVVVVSLGMIFIVCEVFWGLMVYVMIGGIVVVMLFMLIFLLVLYVVWYWILELGC